MYRFLFCFLFIILSPSIGLSFTFSYNNTSEIKNYRLFSASLQKVEQNVGISKVSFEQAYEAFLRTSNVDAVQNTFHLKGEYHYSQRLFQSNKAFNAIDRNKIYRSHFKRMGNGKIEVFSEQDVYPSVRSVPVFPVQDIKIGETWSDIGYEAQDFSILNYNTPFIVPFNAKYQYIQDISITEAEIDSLIARYKQYQFDINQESKNYILQKPLEQIKVLSTSIKNKNLAILHVFYIVDYSARNNPKQTQNMLTQNRNPVEKARGYYNGLVFWDKDTQEEVLTIGEYDFTYLWRNKEQRHWSGKEYGVVTVLYKDKQAIEDLAQKAQEINKDMEVSKEEQGIKLILGDLLFNFNKTTLRPEVKFTLLKITQLLKENPHSAIHITGHSDDIGSEDAKINIAQGRAASVADFFTTQGIDPSRITFAGESDKKPRVPNISPENRQKNRRVEIDIITQ